MRYDPQDKMPVVGMEIKIMSSDTEVSLGHK